MLHTHIKIDSEILLHIFLNRITFLRLEEKNFLAKHIGGADKISLLTKDQLENFLHRSFSNKVIWNGQENLRCAKIALECCKKLDIQLVLNTDVEYPELLRQISDPPYLLYCRGNFNLLTEKTVSVVGSRKITPMGRNAAIKFAYDAVNNGITVVSGLANGADGFAHQGCLNAYFDALENNIPGDQLAKLGRTIAVLPNAIDEIIPYSHKNLAMKILQTGGLLVSEYEPRLEMAKWHFVGRNRIIAGLSPATVVIEAPDGSGSLITADFALENGRDVLFHEVGFSENAKIIAKSVKKNLEAEYQKGKVSKYKIENTSQKFLDAGAPIVKDFDDYLKALSEVPGTRAKVPQQGELFI